MMDPNLPRGDGVTIVETGRMTDYGHSVPGDPAGAARVYREAAEQGDVAAQINLGVLYELGQGVPQDYVQAHVWYALAAAGASEPELGELAAANRALLAGKMSPAQIAEAQRLADQRQLD